MSKRTTRRSRPGTATRILAAGVAVLLLAACGREPAVPAAAASGSGVAPAYFDWFEYTGRDAAFEAPVPDGSFRNPVLSGFHSDPSITAANGKFYLVASTFTFFPGIPVFESEDLVHWKQVGNAIHRPGQLDFDGLGVSRGVFAPAIEYHDGTFYVVNTSVDAGGNFIVTATDPAGPWSDPFWLPDIGGIDPSLFFDDDGKVYILNNDEPEVPVRYDGHRAIWLQEIDIAGKKPFGPRKVLIDGGVKPEENPIWIEGPHIYKVDGWYYLSDAEGGTGPQHSQVVLRSRNVWGPYEPYRDNPILTQRDLDPNRPLPITNAGHADLVQGPDGTWWATFLASRNYGVAPGKSSHYNTGREAFLLPVTWKDGWPVILPHGEKIPYVLPGPSFMKKPADQAPMTGNFTWRDEFDTVGLGKGWMTPRVPKTQWYDGAGDRASSEVIHLTEGSILGGADAAMVPITTIVGEVTDASTGDPVADVCAYLYPVGSQNSAGAACTGADGKAARGWDHDPPAKRKWTPLGILMLATGALTILFGVRETSDFWVDGLKWWWQRVKDDLPAVRRLVIYLDNGPNNSGTRTQFLKPSSKVSVVPFQCAGPEDGDLVRHLHRFLQVMRDEDDGLAQGLLHAQELILDHLAIDRVDRAERLVHQHHGRVGRQSAQDTDALLLAAG